VRWFAKYAAADRYLLLRDAREWIDLLDGVGRHDQVAVVRLERRRANMAVLGGRPCVPWRR
jgi:hypothetical protein